MTVYSYSRVNTFFTCPAQFKFRYIDRLPSPSPEGVELFMGSRFHEAMEFLYHQVPGRLPTVNEVIQEFDRNWKKEMDRVLQKQRERGFTDPLRIVQPGQALEDFFNKGRLFLENYYHRYTPFDQDRTEGIEMKVTFDLDAKGEYKMQGYIDRLGRDDEGTLWIHDYKTSSRKMSEEDARSEDQLALYQIGLEQHPKFGPKEQVKLLWHFVAFEKDQVTAERNPKEIGWLKEKYVSKIKTIEKAREFPTKTSALCGWCEYLPVCAEGKKAVEARQAKKDRAQEGAVPSAVLNRPSSVAPPPSQAPTFPPPPAVVPTAPVPVPSRKGKRSPVSEDQLRLF